MFTLHFLLFLIFISTTPIEAQNNVIDYTGYYITQIVKEDGFVFPLIIDEGYLLLINCKGYVIDYIRLDSHKKSIYNTYFYVSSKIINNDSKYELIINYRYKEHALFAIVDSEGIELLTGFGVVYLKRTRTKHTLMIRNEHSMELLSWDRIYSQYKNNIYTIEEPDVIDTLRTLAIAVNNADYIFTCETKNKVYIVKLLKETIAYKQKKSFDVAR